MLEDGALYTPIVVGGTDTVEKPSAKRKVQNRSPLLQAAAPTAGETWAQGRGAGDTERRNRSRQVPAPNQDRQHPRERTP